MIYKERTLKTKDLAMIENLMSKNMELESKLNAVLEHQGVKVKEIDSGVYEVVKEENGSGDYTNPINIPTDGITTIKGLWYYVDDKDLPHEAIQDAFVVPEDFNDKTWFGFVE